MCSGEVSCGAPVNLQDILFLASRILFPRLNALVGKAKILVRGENLSDSRLSVEASSIFQLKYVSVSIERKWYM